MSEGRGDLERRFERALVDVLAHDHGLDVRHPEDPLDRRRESVATLRFSYRYPPGGDAKAVVSIEDARRFSTVLPVDFSSQDGIERSAEQCDCLVSFLRDFLTERGAAVLDQAASGQLKYGRRDDDLA